MTHDDSSDSRSRILLVEDDETTRYLVVAWLTREGYAVDGFGDAESALESLRHATYHALVTDQHLPEMQGIELVRVALEEGLLRPAQIVIASSFPPVAEARAIGVGTLQKPVDVHTLIERVERLLGADGPVDLPPRSNARPAVRLVLYVSKGSAASARAQRAAWHFAQRPGAEHVHLEVRDVAEHGEAAATHRIAFTPTLLRLDPPPSIRVIGDLRDETILADAVAVWSPP